MVQSWFSENELCITDRFGNFEHMFKLFNGVVIFWICPCLAMFSTAGLVCVLSEKPVLIQAPASTVAPWPNTCFCCRGTAPSPHLTHTLIPSDLLGRKYHLSKNKYGKRALDEQISAQHDAKTRRSHMPQDHFPTQLKA